MKNNWKAEYHLIEELRETSREHANKRRHEHEIHVCGCVLIRLRKHDAEETIVHSLYRHFVVIRQTAPNAF